MLPNILLILVSLLSFGLGKLLYIFYVRTPKDLKRFGNWAVVTGATDGIGAAYARELASRGMNIVLVSRTLSKLEEFSEEIRQQYTVETKVVVVDFTQIAPEALEAVIKESIDGLDIGLLVNNVGASYDYPEYFHNVPTTKIDAIVQLNMQSVLHVTAAVLPGMVARKRGAIVNISSASGLFPSGLLTVYSASKAFVDFFSRGLAQEYRELGVHVQSVLPLYVTTKLSKLRHSSFFVPTPKAFAKQAITTIGYEERTTGYFAHALEIAVSNFVPAFLLQNYLFGMHATIRRLAYKKKKNQ